MTTDQTPLDVEAIRARLDAATFTAEITFDNRGGDGEFFKHAPTDLRRLLDENARLNAENARCLQIVNEITRDNAGLTACLDAVLTVVPQLRMVFGSGPVQVDTVAHLLNQALEAAPEMPRPPAEEAPTEYLCPRCERWALWTDGETDSDSGVWTFWCQTCSAETPLESMDSRPQKAASGPETPGTGSGRGTGVAEAPGSDQEYAEHELIKAHTHDGDCWICTCGDWSQIAFGPNAVQDLTASHEQHLAEAAPSLPVPSTDSN